MVRHLGRPWDLAIVFGELSVVAHVLAKQTWEGFKAALKDDAAHGMSDVAYLRAWDFRYWHTVGLWSAWISILCSVAWLIA